MRSDYEKTEKFLIKYIKEKGITKFSRLTIKEYHKYAYAYNLLTVQSLHYITGLNWRQYKDRLIKRSKGNVLQRIIKSIKWRFKM